MVFAEEIDYISRAEEVVERNREKKITELYAKKLNAIRNLEARIEKLEEEILEIDPDTIQVELDEDWDSNMTLEWSPASTQLIITGK